MGGSEETYAIRKFEDVNKGEEKQHADCERSERRALKDVAEGSKG